MKVRNLLSTRGNVMPNQFEISDGNRRYFQSYNSIICVVENGRVTLDVKYWDWSRTTSKYRNIFLGETTAETRAKIQSGEYQLANLN